MNVLCSDKTGTLTEGMVRSCTRPWTRTARRARRCCSTPTSTPSYETRLRQPHRRGDPDARPVRTCPAYRKLDEVPYDFIREAAERRGGATSGKRLLITKGALSKRARGLRAGGRRRTGRRGRWHDERDALSESGSRSSASRGSARWAWRSRGRGPDDGASTRIDETEMTFLGFLVLDDPPKPGVARDHRASCKTWASRSRSITGDNRLVAAQRRPAGRPAASGRAHRSRAAPDERRGPAASRAPRRDVFAEIEPNQKERIILALRKAGNVVGYMGDGINDALGPARRRRRHLGRERRGCRQGGGRHRAAGEGPRRCWCEGVREGRRTFANTLKYVFMATSANFGNMFSMAGASLFLPFLPLLPKQILLTNLLTDFPEMTIATDRVDHELVRTPRRWDIRLHPALHAGRSAC